jgi:hypothetical protein
LEKTVHKLYHREECGGSLNAACCIFTLKGIILILMKYCVLVIVGYWLLLLLLLLAVGFVGCDYCRLLVIVGYPVNLFAVIRCQLCNFLGPSCCCPPHRPDVKLSDLFELFAIFPLS